MYHSFGKLPESISNILKTAGQTAGVSALTQLLIKQGLSPEEAKASAMQLIIKEKKIPIYKEPSFFEQNIFGIPIIALLGGGVLLTFILLRRR